MKSFLKILLIGLFVQWPATANEQSNASNSITRVIEKYQTALNASDVDTVMSLYGKKPTFMPQHAPAQIGKESIKQAYRQVFKNIGLDVEFTIWNIEVLGDTAWVRTSSAGKTTILANNSVVSEGNNELFILKNTEGLWKIHQYIFSTNQPPN